MPILLLFFTDTELYYIYTKFDYLSVTKLYNLLIEASYNIKASIFKNINKFCYHYQIKK